MTEWERFSSLLRGSRDEIEIDRACEVVDDGHSIMLYPIEPRVKSVHWFGFYGLPSGSIVCTLMGHGTEVLTAADALGMLQSYLEMYT